MSNLRQGVLRAVRLLPEVVKVGVNSETALPSVRGEEQLLIGNASPNISEAVADSAAREADVSKLGELNGQVAALEAQLSDAKLVEQDLLGKIASLESELGETRDDFARKKRELDASAESVKNQARDEGKAQGYSEGLSGGHEAGLAKARSEIEEQYRERFTGLVTALEGISSRLEENFAELVLLNQPRMVRLWQEMLKKMLRREAVLAPDAVLDVLADVLSRLSDRDHILIYVSPEDIALLEAHLHQEFEDILRSVKHLELKPDASVDRGSCIVETNLGVYDARWRTQLDQIEMEVEKLFQKLGKAPSTEKKVSARAKKAESAPDVSEPAPAPQEAVEKTSEKKTASKKKKTEQS